MNNLFNVKSLRLYSFLPFIATVLMIAYAYYEQYVNYLNPCPLCLIQRFIIVAIGILYFFTFILPPQKIFRTIMAIVISLVALCGVAVSSRHIWLQNLPADEVPACGPGLSYMFDNFPIGTFLSDLFTGSGECAEISWRFLGLTMPMWTLLCFVGFLIYTILWAKLKKV
ncbi:MAG: disulfide bond formation protein B [Proteobacteria bacterium]|nr:disulfide bond formation protein B [Pseudomonadota bacterium]